MENYIEWMKASGNLEQLLNFADDPAVLRDAIALSYDRFCEDHPGEDLPDFDDVLEELRGAIEKKARRA